ncbi:MAG: creatininase family protein [Saccharolobus sp.]
MRIVDITKNEIKENMVALIPMGSIEQHGPHLPMGTDGIIAEYVSSKVEERLKDLVLLFPTIYYGVSIEHKGLPFVSLTFNTIINMINDILESIVSNLKIKKIVIVNGHGGNSYFLPLVQREFNMKHDGSKVVIYNTFRQEERELFGVNDMHAGTIETSKIYVIDKKLVRVNEIDEIKDYSVKKGVFTFYSTGEANRYGVINDGKRIEINEKMGLKVLEMMIEELVNLILNFNF